MLHPLLKYSSLLYGMITKDQKQVNKMVQIYVGWLQYTIYIIYNLSLPCNTINAIKRVSNYRLLHFLYKENYIGVWE